ncbi:hypothetical protein KEM48_006842 [Puccinia striiformis f. sp. tritici PST-130]|nr:hypothetical protein KEM48_006842 [Puccinia striiformis f. sp. tritici PST-130]
MVYWRRTSFSARDHIEHSSFQKVTIQVNPDEGVRVGNKTVEFATADCQGLSCRTRLSKSAEDFASLHVGITLSFLAVEAIVSLSETFLFTHHSLSTETPRGSEAERIASPIAQKTAMELFTKVNVPQGDEGGELDDLEGCRWNIPGNYDGPGFDECEGEDVLTLWRM